MPKTIRKPDLLFNYLIFSYLYKNEYFVPNYISLENEIHATLYRLLKCQNPSRSLGTKFQRLNSIPKLRDQNLQSKIYNLQSTIYPEASGVKSNQKWLLLIPNFCILEASVVGGSPNISEAPPAPLILPLHFSSTLIMCSLSFS